MNEEQLNEFVAAVDANVMFCVQSAQKMEAEIALIKRYAKVSANEGHLWDISGYVYGRTSNDDPYILLYPSHPKMIHKVTRVYDHQFYELPSYIPTYNIPTDAPDNNPTKDQATNKNIYHDCPVFEIATKDGKETNMGPEQRFFMTVDIPSERAAAASAAVPQAVATEVYAQAEATESALIVEEETTVVEETASDPPASNGESASGIITLNDTVAKSTLNRLLGINDPDPEPEEPYEYADGSEVANNAKLNSIYIAHWKETQTVAVDGSTLQSWYLENKQDLLKKELI